MHDSIHRNLVSDKVIYILLQSLFKVWKRADMDFREQMIF